MKNKYINREISWLSFNERVLQEAKNKETPLLERLKFLGIFSSNLDEFFRVRVATLKRLLNLKKSDYRQNLLSKKELIDIQKKIHDKVILIQSKFDLVYQELISDLKVNQIVFLNEKQLTFSQIEIVRKYFIDEIVNTIFPIILHEKLPIPFLRDNTIYLACKLSYKNKKGAQYALIPLPTKVKKRFYIIQEKSALSNVIFIDDVIRANLDTIFSCFDFDQFEAYTIKITRDAEIDLEQDVNQNLIDKLKESLKLRKKGEPVRFIYDKDIPSEMLKFILNKLKIKNSELIAGQRYHNFKDFMKFPDIKKNQFKYHEQKPLYINEIDRNKTIFNYIAINDILLNHPYQSFSYVIRFLREAAIDPKVFAIKICLYRVAENSNVVNSLINAVKNGKKVVVMMELKARFDEEHNIYWSDKLKEAGAHVIHGISGMKVHSKICLVYRKEEKGIIKYAHLSTGNYNGDTAKTYCDSEIITCNKKITNDVEKVFNKIENFNLRPVKFTSLLVSPFNFRKKIIELIENEIKNKKIGLKAEIFFKLNSLVDEEIIDQLYKASQAGIKVNIIIRGICCLKPGIKNLSDNIKIISIVDRYLEHSRIYKFHNSGKELIYLSSADLMTRNIDYRIEVTFPILEENNKKIINNMIDIQLNDNVKARIIDENQTNKMVEKGFPQIQAQNEFYSYLKLSKL